MGPSRLPLLRERRHPCAHRWSAQDHYRREQRIARTLFLVLRREQRVEQPPLVPQALIRVCSYAAFTASLLVCTAIVLLVVITLSIATASFRISPSSSQTMHDTMRQSDASLSERLRLVSMGSMVSDLPIVCARRYVPPPPGTRMTLMLISGWRKVAVGEARMRSHMSASSQPLPTCRAREVDEHMSFWGNGDAAGWGQNVMGKERVLDLWGMMVKTECRTYRVAAHGLPTVVSRDQLSSSLHLNASETTNMDGATHTPCPSSPRCLPATPHGIRGLKLVRSPQVRQRNAICQGTPASKSLGWTCK